MARLLGVVLREKSPLLILGKLLSGMGSEVSFLGLPQQKYCRVA
jgi:hypothetical protein